MVCAAPSPMGRPRPERLSSGLAMGACLPALSCEIEIAERAASTGYYQGSGDSIEDKAVRSLQISTTRLIEKKDRSIE